MTGLAFHVVVLFTVISGTIASVFACLAWYLFRRTRAHTVFAAFVGLLVVGTGYHAAFYLERVAPGAFGPAPVVSLRALRVVTYAALAAVIVATALFNRSLTKPTR